MAYDVLRLPPRIAIGKEGENKYTEVEIDVSKWAVPNATFAIVIQRADGTAYPVTVTRTNDVIKWIPTATDLKPGYGKLEVRMTKGDVIAKSVVIATYCSPSLNAGAEPSEETPDWVQDIIDAYEQISPATTDTLGLVKVDGSTVTVDADGTLHSVGGGGTVDAYTKAETNTLLSAKQNTLVSGTNIKTVNGNSLLGSGNIEIQGGSGSGDITTKIFIDTLSANRKRDFAFRDMPKAQFALILDDCLPSVVSLCVTNAVAKNVPLNMSAISQYFTDLCTKGKTDKTVLEEIKRGLDNGGEVLLHGNGTINADNIDNEAFLKTKFLDEKETFITNGLNPRGVIVIGGGNEIYGDARTDRWVRALFDYSDGYGIGEPYYHRRNAPTSLDAAKTIIDTAIANKTFCPIFAHKWYDFWNDMIDYAIAQGGEWVTYSTVYDTYGTTKSVKAMETRIKALEQGGGGTPTLSSISATKTTTSYTVGDTLSTSDITVIAHYSDETTEVVTSSATIDASGVDMSASGTYSISVTYESKSTSISITVAETPSPSGTVIYQVSTLSGTCNGTADQKIGSSSTSWTSGKQYKYEFDYEVTAVADDSTTVSVRDVNGGDLGVTINNATVGTTGSVNKTVSNSVTRSRQAFVLKNVSNKSYSVKLTNVKVTEL